MLINIHGKDKYVELTNYNHTYTKVRGGYTVSTIDGGEGDSFLNS